jgi:phosphoribosyl-ATP pyrophosphohydrolase/phosphoribosyl-AMP cyclohydrolase
MSEFNMMNPDFSKGDGLIPVIVQHYLNLQVLMLGYMNEEAFIKTTSEGRITFYSRSKKRLWMKGETSGNFLLVKGIQPDCDNDCLLIQAEPKGPTCHTGAISCFDEIQNKGFLYDLEDTIRRRIETDESTSYTNQLFKKGINKVAQKLGEEAVELVIEAKDNNKDLFLNEAADLMYHYLLLLRAKEINLEDVERLLKERSG